MTPDKVEAALAVLRVSAASVHSGAYVRTATALDIEQALATLTSALAAKDAELNSLAAGMVAEDCREKLIAASEKLPKDEWRAICAMFAECERINDALEDQLESAKEALAESRRDAARYRWLRDKSNDAKPGTPTVYSCCWAHRDELDGHLLDGESLDTAIDTAMKDTDCELSDAEMDATTDYRGHDPDYDRKDTDHAR